MEIKWKDVVQMEKTQKKNIIFKHEKADTEAPSFQKPTDNQIQWGGNLLHLKHRAGPLSPRPDCLDEE